MSNKIIRSICFFDANPSLKTEVRLKELAELLQEQDYLIQTKRICSPIKKLKDLASRISDSEILISAGTLDFLEAVEQLRDFFEIPNLSFNIDLTGQVIERQHADFLFSIIEKKPEKTFNFAYVFNNQHSSPYFPSAAYNRDGFALGLQSTDLFENCSSLKQWFEKMQSTWQELDDLFLLDPEYLGIDSSVAPLFTGKSSLVNLVEHISPTFSQSVLSDVYLQMTRFIKSENPKPIGLCGLMFPCLEDFELTHEYEQGNFSLERNLFLSLHSGLGVDTYPLGVDEDREKVLNVLRLVQGLSDKYKKPLSIRFVSDGQAKIGERTSFGNQYLKDVIIRHL